MTNEDLIATILNGYDHIDSEEYKARCRNARDEALAKLQRCDVAERRVAELESEIVHQRSRVAALQDLCKRALTLASHGNYRNGVTCEAGTSDEGEYYASKEIEAITAELNKI